MRDTVMINGQSVGYGEMVKRLFKKMAAPTDDLMHAAIGISGEAGEPLDAVKKNWVYNKPLDRANVVEELGDIEFYLEALREELKITRSEVLQVNAAKLSERYKSGVYSDAQAIARMDKQNGQPA